MVPMFTGEEQREYENMLIKIPSSSFAVLRVRATADEGILYYTN